MRLEGCLLGILLLAPPPAAAADSPGLARVDRGTVQLTLPNELGLSWREVNVGRLGVRTPRGRSSLIQQIMPAAAHLELEAPQPGCSLLEVDLGPANSRGHSDSWQRMTRCSKIVICNPTGKSARDRKARRDVGVVLTAKTGSRIEIRPLFNPLLLPPGSDLPVRLYFEGEAVAGARVAARGPGGIRVEATSDRVGIATLTLPIAGSWTLSYQHRGTVADLVFEIAKG